MPHDAWRQALPFVIDTYKHGIATVEQELVTAWYRLTSLLAEVGTVGVTVGGVDLGASWAQTPFHPVGLYHGSVVYRSHTGNVVITVHTPSSGAIVFQVNPIASDCSTWNGYTNYNAYTGFQPGSVVSANPALNILEQVCMAGFGVNNFAGLCSFSCGLDYCPVCITRRTRV